MICPALRRADGVPLRPAIPLKDKTAAISYMHKVEEQAVEAFLKDHTKVGEHHSEGEFTLASEAAVKKLSESALENKNEWLLKAVQFAVAAEAQALEIKIGRDDILVCLSPRNSLDLGLLNRQITQPENLGDPAIMELAVGLRALLAHHQFSVSTSVGKALSWDGKAFSILSALNRKGPKNVVYIEVSTKNLKPKVCHRSRDAAEYQLALNRARYAPLALTVDGRCLRAQTTPFKPVDHDHRRSRRSGVHSTVLLYAEFQCTENGPVLGTKKGPDRASLGASSSHIPFRQLRLEQSSPARGTLELLISFMEVRGYTEGKYLRSRIPKTEIRSDTFSLSALRLGVVCGTWSLPDQPLGGHLALPIGASWRTDLSGLKVQRTDGQETEVMVGYLSPITAQLEKLALELDAQKRSAPPGLGPKLMVGNFFALFYGGASWSAGDGFLQAITWTVILAVVFTVVILMESRQNRTNLGKAAAESVRKFAKVLPDFTGDYR